MKYRFPFYVVLVALAYAGAAAPALAASVTKAAPPSGAPVVIDRIEASVNLALVLRSDLDRFRHTIKLRKQLDPLFSGTALATKGERATDSEIAQFLINERLIAQQFPVSDAEVEQEINSIQANNHIDRETLKRALSEQGFAFEEYFELIRMSASKRNLIDRDIRTKVAVSDDDVKNYFYNHFTRSSSTPLSYKLQIISVATRNYKSLGAARDVAQRAVSALKSGEQFEEVAKQMSDHASASSGGDLGVVTEDEMSPLIREQVKKLKIGQVSDVFGGASAGAFNIIRLVDVKSGENDRFEKAKEEIRNQLAAGEYQHQISLWLERQQQKAFIHQAGDAATAGLSTQPSSTNTR